MLKRTVFGNIIGKIQALRHQRSSVRAWACSRLLFRLLVIRLEGNSYPEPHGRHDNRSSPSIRLSNRYHVRVASVALPSWPVIKEQL